MKNDRAHNRPPRESLARGDTGSEGIQKLGGSYTPDRRWEMVSCIPSRTRYCHSRMLLSGILERSQNKISAFAGMTGIQRWNWSPPYGKPPTGFSELDVGRPANVECDVGRMINDNSAFVSFRDAFTRNLMKDEIRFPLTTRGNERWLDEVCYGRCLAMVGKWAHICMN